MTLLNHIPGVFLTWWSFSKRMDVWPNGLFLRPDILKLIKTLNETLCAIWYHLYNLKKREKHPWRSVTFSKVPGQSLHGIALMDKFSCLFNPVSIQKEDLYRETRLWSPWSSLFVSTGHKFPINQEITKSQTMSRESQWQGKA